MSQIGGQLDRFLERWGGQVAIVGGLLWTASWLLNVSFTDSSGEGTRLGFTEGNARSILNPAIPLIIIGVLAFQRCLERRPSVPGASGAALATIVGLLLLLTGNLLEFGAYGTSPVESEDPGFAVFSLGLLITLIGHVWFIVIGINARALSRWETIGLGLLSLSVIPMATFGLGWILWGFVLARRGGFILPAQA